MKWDDISKRVPGRSPLSCRLHYQNFLGKRNEWGEEQKNKLSRLYQWYVTARTLLPLLTSILRSFLLDGVNMFVPMQYPY